MPLHFMPCLGSFSLGFRVTRRKTFPDIDTHEIATIINGLRDRAHFSDVALRISAQNVLGKGGDERLQFV